MRISGRPTFSPDLLTIKPSDGLPDVFPFNTNRCEFFYSARYAIAATIDVLALTSDQAVLLPSYNCGVEVDPFIRRGMNVQWYRVNRDLTIDFDDLIGRITPSTSAILVTHYLGFPQQLDKIISICKDRGIVLIEDCAHAMLSDNSEGPLGTFGDIAVFSFRKTLPIPDGGGLIINNPNLILTRNRIKRPNLFSTYYVISEMLKIASMLDSNSSIYMKTVANINQKLTYALRLMFRIIKKLNIKSTACLVYPHSNNFYDEVVDCNMSKISENIIKILDYTRIKELRRNNYEYLIAKLVNDDRFVLPIPELPNGACPLLLPIIIDKRDQVFMKLKEKGISGYDWWKDFHNMVPWSEFNESALIKNKLLGLPVHQDLTSSQLDTVYKEFINAINALR